MKFDELGEICNARTTGRRMRTVAKLSVHRSGRGGFSAVAAREMGLTKETGVLFAVNGADLYAKVTTEDARAYPLRLGSGFYTLDMRALLESQGINYKDQSQTIIYDITRHGVDDQDGGVIWKLTKRVLASHKEQP